MHSKTVLGAVLAASLMGFGAAAQAQQFVVQIAPPAPQYEVAPAPRQGYVWDAGHYEWRGNQYVWVPGRWISARDGEQWQERRWVQRGNGEWVMVGGNWERRGPMGDRDRDGVPNYADSRNDNRRDRERDMRPWGDLDRDGIRNRDDRDIDGDGVRNRHDSHPYNPRRS